MLIDANRSLFLMIDLQEKLAPAIHDSGTVIDDIRWLAQVARKLSVPVAATVHYPTGLGNIVPSLAGMLAPSDIVEKIHFSAVADGRLAALPDFDRPQVVLTGTETHVCVLQTALDLLALGKQVYVVAECVGSRRPDDRLLGLERMRQEGCRIVSKEMVAYEWLQRAGTDVFRQIHREFLR